MRKLAVTLRLPLCLGLALTTFACTAAHKPSGDPNTSSETDSVSRDGSASVEPSDRSETSNPSETSEISKRKGSADLSDVVTTPSEPAMASSQPSRAPTADGAGNSDSSNTGESAPRKIVITDKDEPGAGKCQEGAGGLVLSVDRKTVSLEDGRLQAKMSGPICNLSLRITNKQSEPILEKAFRYTGPERELRWTPIPRELIEKVEIRIAGDDGAYQSVFLIPWSVAIEHEEVRFDTNKAIIRDSEVASLDDSLNKIKDVLATVEGKDYGTVTLFIAGHTDTQGSDEHNMVLSRNRAQAIANWFLKKGLCIPIAFDGFGESALKKVTADNVDEQANRRVDYILAVEPPTIKKGASPAWKYASKGC